MTPISPVNFTKEEQDFIRNALLEEGSSLPPVLNPYGQKRHCFTCYATNASSWRKWLWV